jgi:integrase
MDESWPSFAFLPDSDWGQAYTSFLKIKHEHSGSQSTHRQYKYALDTFFSTEPTKQPDLYTRQEVLAFIFSPGNAPGRVGNAVSAGTSANRLSIITEFYRYASGYGIEDENGIPVPLMSRLPPTAGLKPPQRERPKPKYLTSDELRRFFAAIPRDTIIGKRNFAIFSVYFFTARRRAEIVRLRWGDISESIIIEHETRRSGYVYRFTSKGKSRQADSEELPEPAYNAIIAYLQESGRLASIQDLDPIFIAHHVGRNSIDVHRPIAAQTVYLTCKRIARKAGIPVERVSPHSFRHTSSRMRYENSPDVRAIQKILRHQSISTTDTYLRELTTASDQGAIRLGEMFGDL